MNLPIELSNVLIDINIVKYGFIAKKTSSIEPI